MKSIKQEVCNSHIPEYLQEILTNNYCPNFLKMSMVRENDDYTLRYQADRYKKIQIKRLNTYKKIVLLKSIFELIDKNEDWLIRADSYLIEPELIYSIDNSVDTSSIKLLFYPDYAMNNVSRKMSNLSKKITNFDCREEVDLMNRFRQIVDRCDFNRARIFLDKNIFRMETRT